MAYWSNGRGTRKKTKLLIYNYIFKKSGSALHVRETHGSTTRRTHVEGTCFNLKENKKQILYIYISIYSLQYFVSSFKVPDTW